MTQVVASVLARSDISQILQDLAANAGIAVAVRYRADFTTLFLRLEMFPESGSPRINLGENVRIFVVWPYVVIYEYSPMTDTASILRVLHGRRRILRRLLR